MFGSVNVLANIDQSLTVSKFTPIDVVSILGINAGLTMKACDSDSFRIMTPVIGEKIAEYTGDKYGWLGDARFVTGLLAAGVAHFGSRMTNDMGEARIGAGTVRGLHDLTAGCWTSLVATEVCRSKADEEIKKEGGSLALGMDDGLLDDDFGLDDDLMGLDEYADAGSMNFAYGW